MLRDFKAYQLAKEFHWACKRLKLPLYHQDQLLRASSSIALNLAEGSGKRTPADQRRFYGMALGSLRECEAILELEQLHSPELQNYTVQLGAMLFRLSRVSETKRAASSEAAPP